MRVLDKNYLGLLREIIISQFKLKDQSTFLGLMWSFLHPLSMLVILFIFFNVRMGREVENYPIYLLIGLVHYTHFSNSTGAGMVILSAMRRLACEAVFPKEILVIGSVISNAIEFFISMLICLLIALLWGVKLKWADVLLPLVLLLQIMMVMWISFFLSCLYVFVKDIGHLYQVFLRILFFVTPIFYAPSFVGRGVAKYIVLLNPLTHLVSFSREIIIGGSGFPAKSFFVLLLLNISLLYLGVRVFRRYEPTFAERI